MKNATRLAWIPLVLAACAGHSPYAGEEARGLKALTASEIEGYREGRGLGLAKPAELNGYPGPMHVLEMADRLELTPEQRTRTQALLDRHKSEARALGADYLSAEASLEALFASGRADAASVDAATARAASLQARVRASHLRTHLEQAALLTPAQVARYNALRGYALPAATRGG